MDEEDTPLDAEDGASTWKRPVSEVQPEEQREVKRPKIVDDAATRKRGARMFGLLTGTLKKFKEETKKTGQSDAVKRRNAVEARLSAKLKAEQELGEKKAERSRTEKSLKLDVHRKIDEKVLLDSIVRRRLRYPVYGLTDMYTRTAVQEETDSGY